MLKPEQIPREAAIAATRDGLSSDDVREIVAAALNAWPNRVTVKDDGRRQTYIIPAIILPLPTEASDEQ